MESTIHDANLRQGNTGSRAVENIEGQLDNSRIEFIKTMSVAEVMETAEKHRKDFSQVHANIASQYLLSNAVTPAQKLTMQTFLIQFADEIGPEGLLSESQQAERAENLSNAGDNDDVEGIEGVEERGFAEAESEA